MQLLNFGPVRAQEIVCVCVCVCLRGECARARACLVRSHGPES